AVLRQPFSRPVVEVFVGLDRTVGDDDTGIAAGRHRLGLRREPDVPAELGAVTRRELHLDGLAAGQPLPAVDRTERVGAERARDLCGDSAVDVAGAVGELLLPLGGIELRADGQVADTECGIVELVANALGSTPLVDLVTCNPRRVRGDSRRVELRV